MATIFFVKKRGRVFLLLFFLSSLAWASIHSTIDTEWKDGSQFHYTAKELWTYFWKYDNYKWYNQATERGEYNKEWMTITDWTDSPWYEDYINDYRTLFTQMTAGHSEMIIDTNIKFRVRTYRDYYWYYIAIKKELFNKIEVDN